MGVPAMEDRMPYAFDGDDRSNEEPWETTEAWRGDVHLSNDSSWLGEETSDWSTGQDEGEEHSGWRGHQHFADWPEELAGPEYWLYKRMAE